MRILIYGAGTAGSYLYRLLKRAGFSQITVADKPEPAPTSCGINPCAWGSSIGFEGLIEQAGLNPADYVLNSFNNMVMNEMKIKAKAVVIDKPKLISNLLDGVEVQRTPLNQEEYDRIIDATGSARAFLPPLKQDIITTCVQYRVSSQTSYGLSIDVSNLGYAWRFPISNNEYHIGAGSMVIPPQKMLEKLGWLNNTSRICACTGKVRLTAPCFSLPFVENSSNGKCPVWGVGEAIGCVAPTVGEGIIPGLKSARILVENWDNPANYQRAVLKEFSWMRKERNLLDKAIKGKQWGLLDAWILMNDTKRYDMMLNFNQGKRLLQSITRIG
jgi:flavin-dependent dehydrogenase